MPHFPKSSASRSDSAILLSVKPNFADLIVDGSKLVELRRVIPVKTLGLIALYSSSPVQAIVALAEVDEVIEASPARLWEISKVNGGGLTRRELFAYFESKKTGFAIKLKNTRAFDQPVKPAKIFRRFTAPQSFRYLTSSEVNKLEHLLELKAQR